MWPFKSSKGKDNKPEHAAVATASIPADSLSDWRWNVTPRTRSYLAKVAVQAIALLTLNRDSNCGQCLFDGGTPMQETIVRANATWQKTPDGWGVLLLLGPGKSPTENLYKQPTGSALLSPLRRMVNPMVFIQKSDVKPGDSVTLFHPGDITHSGERDAFKGVGFRVELSAINPATGESLPHIWLRDVLLDFTGILSDKTCATIPHLPGEQPVEIVAFTSDNPTDRQWVIGVLYEQDAAKQLRVVATTPFVQTPWHTSNLVTSLQTRLGTLP